MQININNPHLASYTPDSNAGSQSQAKTSTTSAQVSTSHIRPAATDRDTQIKTAMKNAFAAKFGKLAGKPAEFHAFTKKIFGAGYDQTKAESLRKKALAGDYSWLPKVEFQSRATLQGANGAYAKSKDTIYIADDLKSNPALAGQTFIEEAGHAIDARINKKDTPGDEGEMFRRVLNGEKLSQAQINEIRNENDHHTITVNGEKVETEFFFKKIKKAFKRVTRGVKRTFKKVVGGVGNVVRSVARGVKRVAKKIISVPQKIFGAAKNVFSKVGNIFKKVLSFPKAILGRVFNVARGIFGKVGGIFNKVLSFPKAILGRVFNFGRNIFNKVLSFPKAILGRVTNFAKNIFGKVGGVFQNVFGAGMGIAKSVFGFASRFLNPVGAITNAISAVTNVIGWGVGHTQNFCSNVAGMFGGFVR
ncbi:MAG: hypothetical protein HKN20_12105 [Gemmatimonadetes bacterium]|nr:hypothetical protein [Gemmatimonadota bacterium]